MTARRAQRLLALTPAEAELLTGLARARYGRGGYAIRSAAFALATAPLLRRAIPRRVRVRAIRPLLHGMLPGPAENALYTEAHDRPSPEAR